MPPGPLAGGGVVAGQGALERAEGLLEAAEAAVDQPQVLEEAGDGVDPAGLGQLLPGRPEVAGLGVDLGQDGRVEGVGQPVVAGRQELGVVAGMGAPGGGGVPAASSRSAANWRSSSCRP